MPPPLLLALPGNAGFSAQVSSHAGIETGELEVRRFPDGESYVRIRSPVAGRDIFVLCSLAVPDPQFLPLAYTARLARELGAAHVFLVAPYLAYLRQDRRFAAGEAVTSHLFSGFVEGLFDGLICVDPHLHRLADLGALYAIPTRVVHAASVIGAWIRANVERPLVVGPDEESRQWAAEIGRLAGAPFVTFGKERHGDRDVTLSVPALDRWRGRQPVLVDDIISSGATAESAALALARAGFAPPDLIAVHGLFVDDSFHRLAPLTRQILTTDSIAHPTNGLSVAPLVAAAMAELARSGSRESFRPGVADWSAR